MIEFLQFILTIGVVYQVTSLISESSFPLFKWLRDVGQFVYKPEYDSKFRERSKYLGWIGDFFGCFLCVSVWIGFIGSVVLFDIGNFLGYESVSWAISGLFYSFIVWFIHLIEGKLS